MKREPKIVQRGSGRWAVITSDKKGGVFLDGLFDGDAIGWEVWSGLAIEPYGQYTTESAARKALAKAPPVPDDAVWDDDNTAPQTVQPQPAMEWKPIAETLDELRGVSPLQSVLAYFPHTKNTTVVEAGDAVEYHAHDTWDGAAWMPLPAPPKPPPPTLAELERAVAEAVDAMKRHGVYAKGSLEDVLITRHDALLAHRERANNNSGDAAGVK